MLAICIFLVIALAACQLITGIHDEEGATPPEAGAAEAAGLPDAAGDGQTVLPMTCVIEPSFASDASMASPTVGVSTTFALRTLSFVGGAGLDLDCRNTQMDADLPCKGSPNDGDGGADNEFFAGLSYAVSGGGGDPTGAHFTAQFALGAETLLLRIDNVAPPFPMNVSGLQLGIVGSYGLKSLDCAASADSIEGGTPKWDGCDSWWQDSDFAGHGTDGVYISGSHLVAVYKDPLTFTFNEITVRLYGVVVTARIVTTADAGADSGSLVTLEDGIIGGRMKTADALEAVIGYHVPGKTPVCQSAMASKLLRDKLCSLQDLPSSGAGSADAVCDSVSINLAFQAVETALSHGGAGFDNDAGCPPFDGSCEPRP